jgi:succinoglycan biosynthesis protein ExoW
MPPQFAVVIPFYQRNPGILGKALRSIWSQQGVGDVHVIVVDDASPCPAEQEDPGTLPAGFTLQIVRRVNGGPAAARNTGLSMVPPGTRYVAFLDSDDEWSPRHLARAAFALAAGHGFYFANLLHLGQTISAFDRTGRLKDPRHTAIAGEPELHTYAGDMFDQIMRGNMIGTSTVVFDAIAHAGIRFREEFYSAGEDYLCWMDFARAGARFAFSTQVEAVYGRGVNIYSGAQWGTVEHLERVHNEFRYRDATGRLHQVTPEQRDYLAKARRELREEFGGDLLHLIASRRLPPWRIVRRQAALDPASLIEPVRLVLRKLLRRR